MPGDREPVDAETDRERIRDMIQISAVAPKARVSALAALAATFAFSVAQVSAQEEPGPWMPPEGSVAGPSSENLPQERRPAPVGYPAPGGSFDGMPPRHLDPIYRGAEAGGPASHAAPVAAASFPSYSEPAYAQEANLPRPAPAPLPGVPPISFPPAQRPAPLPPAERPDLRRAVDHVSDRGVVSPIGFDAEVAPKASTDASATADGDGDEAKRLLPPKPEPGEALKSSAGQFPYAATFGSLAAVLGAFFIFVWFQKRGGKRGSGALPPEVVEPLGTVPFVSRQALHVVRFGSKILLINVTPGGSETLAEIDDPREAERILALCRRHRPDALGRTFREILGTPRPAAGPAPADRARGAVHA